MCIRDRSIGLVLVSPNMSYPLQQKQVALAAAAKSQAKIELIDKGALVATATEREQLLNDVTKQQATASLIPDSATSLIGLREPWVQLRNPGLISIPLGFALVILFSLLFPSQLSLSRWVEFSVRRETGLGVAQAAQH